MIVADRPPVVARLTEFSFVPVQLIKLQMNCLICKLISKLYHFVSHSASGSKQWRSTSHENYKHCRPQSISYHNKLNRYITRSSKS